MSRAKISPPQPKKSTTVRSARALQRARVGLHGARLLSATWSGELALRLFTSPHRYPRPERERPILASGRAFELPLVTRSGERLRLAAWRWGAGPSVMLVHGWEGRGAQLGAVIQPLVDAGLEVITFDAPAHGDSPGKRLFLTDMAAAIAVCAGATSDLHGIVAHSFGAAAVMLAHARHGIDAPRNVFIAPNAVVASAVRRFEELMQLDGAARAAFGAALERQSGVTMAELELPRLVAARDAGLLVVHDQDDTDIPLVDGRALAEAWPGARLRVTSGLGHRRILRDAAVVGEVVRAARCGARLAATDFWHAMPEGWQQDNAR
jgi:pimeloyl-ACP methyl ester carboxylesterase